LSIVVALLFVPQPPARAALSAAPDPDPPALDRAAFVERVLAAHPALAVLAARVEAARAEVAGRRVRPNPRLSYGREEVFRAGDGWPEDVVQLEWPIDVSGRRGLRVEAALTAVEAEQAEVDRARLLLLVDALETYDDAARARRVLAVLRETRAPLAAALAAIEKRAAAGEVAAYDAARLELEVAAYDDRIAETATGVTALQRAAALLTGDPDGTWTPADPLDPPAPPGDVEALVAAAVTTRDDLRSARLRVAAAEQAGRAADRAWVPTPVVTGGFKAVDLGPGTGFGYVVGLGLDLPIFDRGQGERAAADADRSLAAAEARFLVQRVPADVRSAHAVLERRTAQVRQFEQTQLPRLDGVLRAADLSYREGERPIGELLDAHRAAREARLRAIDLRWAARRAELALWAALGRREAR
jgi:cobalt-zinc-cadmium efflux system outer membrane protein